MTNVTGRDGYIEGQALVYAIACIQGLPAEKQEQSNMRDMVAIARATTPPVVLATYVYGVECHVGRKLDMHVAESGREVIEYDFVFDQTLVNLHQGRDANCADIAGYISLLPDFAAPPSAH